MLLYDRSIWLMLASDVTRLISHHPERFILYYMLSWCMWYFMMLCAEASNYALHLQHAFAFILVAYHLWLCLFLGEACSMRTPCFSIAFNLSWWLARFGSRRYYLHTLLYLFTVFLDIMRSRILLLSRYHEK